MPDEELLAIREASRKNLEDIARRKKENDPVEVRFLPGAEIHLRVLGFIDGHPVLHGDDVRAWDAYTDSLYKCHYCCDNKRVYLHGEHLEPDVRRRGPGSPCLACCPAFTAANYWQECQRLPGVQDGGVDVVSLMIGAINGYLNRVIPPHITKAQYARLLGPIGSLVSLDKRGLTVTFEPYTNPPDAEAGRLRLVDDQGGTYLKNKKNERSDDES